MKEINISVHGLIDFLLRSGDIDNRIYNSSSMLEGVRMHLRYQKIQNEQYLSEQALETNIEIDGYNFHIEGRADGIILSKNYPIIDEIKTTVIDLETFYNSQREWHLGQALIYAYMYAKTNNLDKMGVRLTYLSQNDMNDKFIVNLSYSFKELEEYLIKICKDYLSFYVLIESHNELKKKSAEALIFPYEKYREGQRELAKLVYGTIINQERLFVEAPTGIGKTMSTLFPAIKTFSTSDTEKIFYLSSKNSQKEIAYNALKILISKGFIGRGIKIKSKEKMCQCDVSRCNPDDCPFAIGYYSKIKEVIRYFLENQQLLDDEDVLKLALDNQMCPFELQLDLSLFCDVIICDYNYLFDPFVYLKRYFDTAYVPYVALIDEAHNLVDRSMNMYSTELSLNKVKKLTKDYRSISEAKGVKKYLRKISNFFSIIEFNEAPQLIIEDFSSDLYSSLEGAFKEMQAFLKNYPKLVSDSFIDLFRDINKFIKLSEFIDENFCLYYEQTDIDVKAIIRCVDSSHLVRDCLLKLKASVFFSATLSPIEYYIESLGGDESTPKILLKSPFDKSNLLKIRRVDISTKYKDRDLSYEPIKRSIEIITSKKMGNYLVYFSSYQYLENVYRLFTPQEGVRLIKQDNEMTEENKKDFINSFDYNPTKTTIGFAVLGGSFSEGIDLTEDKLIGVIVVGVGLPQISFERDIIRDHFNKIELDGYDYAYVYPGINKVHQAAGRVIRTENDVGLVVFIDDRYKNYHYKHLLKDEYKNSYEVKDDESLSKYIEDFWKNKDKHN